jgi:hypothetical protein
MECISTKEMDDYSAMKFYLKQKNLHYFTSYPKSEKLIKAIIHHLPLDMTVEDISNGLEDLGFNIINVRQTRDTQTAPKESMWNPPSIPCYLNKKH